MCPRKTLHRRCCHAMPCNTTGDLQAIAKIGQDGKMDKPAAIGRFGLGFNAT
jgi:hypothetical protein